jgi:hypothetical protein
MKVTDQGFHFLFFSKGRDQNVNNIYTYALYSLSPSQLCLNMNTQLPITHSFSFFNSMERW